MGKKYIIELEDENYHQYSDSEPSDYLWRVKGFNALVFDEVGISKLTPYTEPDLEWVKRDYDAWYEKGLADAWEAARKIWKYDTTTLKAIFGEGIMRMDWFMNFTASEAIEKLKAYEQEQDEIKVGDEVIRHYKSEFAEGDDAPSIFLSEEDGYFRCLAFNGRSIMIAEYPKNQYRKTGRHFHEIAEVLAKMKETDNG